MKHPEIDWVRVERLILKSFRGYGLTEPEQRSIEEAWTVDPGKYQEVGQRVRGEEIARIQRSGG